MHTRGRSKDMYKQAIYNEVVDEVLDELRESIAFAGGAGIPKESGLGGPGSWLRQRSDSQLRSARQARGVQRPRATFRRRASRKGFLTRPLPKEVQYQSVTGRPLLR